MRLHRRFVSHASATLVAEVGDGGLEPPRPKVDDARLHRRFISPASTTHVVEVGDGGLEPPRPKVADARLELARLMLAWASMTHVIEIADVRLTLTRLIARLMAQIYASRRALSTFDLEGHKVYGGLIFALFTVVRDQFDSRSTPPRARSSWDQI